MADESSLPPAGWYPDPELDPSAPSRQRYWDGRAWTAHLAHAIGGPATFTDPARDRHELLVGGRRAKVAVLVGVPVYALTPILQGQQVRASRRAIEDLRAQLEEIERPTLTPGAGHVQMYRTSPIGLLGSAASLPNLVVGVLFLIWFHRAVTVAVRLGRPARRTPGWAVGGWLIPIGNFFLPYQSARDIFPAGDARRAVVRQWWAAYLIAALVNVPLGVLAGFNDHVEVSIAAGAISFVVWLFAALKARELIDAANESLIPG